MSADEVKALRELTHSKHIINPTDKENMVVILSREQYVHEAERQWNDPIIIVNQLNQFINKLFLWCWRVWIA